MKTFFDAINEQSGNTEDPYPYDELEKLFPSYLCEVEMENGFSFTLSYHPQYKHLSFAGAFYEIDDTLMEWITVHGKQ